MYLCLASFPFRLVSSALVVHRLYSVHSQDNIVLLVNHVSDAGRKNVHRILRYNDIHIMNKLITSVDARHLGASLSERYNTTWMPYR